ncbi:MAG: sarcosine oxidase [Alphaproteobacteria bacterium]|nr:sarcosine oxidase [Alphaproteobacteria bacterium]
MAVQPATLNRRSFVYRELAALGATFREVNGCAVAATLAAGRAAEIAAARDLGLADLSGLRRGGYKGWTALDWLRGQGVAIGENNMTLKQGDGSRVARLADSEAMILGDLAGGSALLDRVEAGWSITGALGAYPVPRPETNFWFAIAGRHSDTMLAKICGVDLRPHRFPDGAVAQTSVARMSAIIIRHDLGATLGYDMIADSAAASYMWTSLQDAMDEFGGRPVGLDAIVALAAETGPA